MKAFTIHDCCDTVDCGIASDDFDRSDSSSLGSDWTEVSGSWEISSNQLKCTSAGIARHNTAQPSSSPDMVASVKAKGVNDNSKVRVLVAYSSSSDYLAMELMVGYGATLKLFNGSTQLTTLSVTAAYNQIHTMTLCYDSTNGVLSGTLVTNLGTTYKVSYAGLTNTGTYAGVASPSLGASGVFFDDFSLEYTDSHDASCETCIDDIVCTPCDGSTGPRYIKVTLSGLVKRTGGTDACCDALDGTYILHHDGSSYCNWLLYLDCTNCDPSNCPRLVVNVGGTSIDIYYYEGFGLSVWWSGTLDSDCMNWSNFAVALYSKCSSLCRCTMDSSDTPAYVTTL